MRETIKKAAARIAFILTLTLVVAACAPEKTETMSKQEYPYIVGDLPGSYIVDEKTGCLYVSNQAGGITPVVATASNFVCGKGSVEHYFEGEYGKYREDSF
jgi:hypothetical protein